MALRWQTAPIDSSDSVTLPDGDSSCLFKSLSPPQTQREMSAGSAEPATLLNSRPKTELSGHPISEQLADEHFHNHLLAPGIDRYTKQPENNRIARKQRSKRKPTLAFQ